MRVLVVEDDVQLAEMLTEALTNLPGIRFFWDFDQTISQRFGTIDSQGTYYPCPGRTVAGTGHHSL